MTPSEDAMTKLNPHKCQHKLPTSVGWPPKAKGWHQCKNTPTQGKYCLLHAKNHVHRKKQVHD